MYADQYRDHLLTMCPGGKGLAGFIGEGMGGMTAAMMQPKGQLMLHCNRQNDLHYTILKSFE